MPLCPNCGSQQSTQAMFCDECGMKLERSAPAAEAPVGARPCPSPTAVASACPACGAQVMSDWAFCGGCGAPLGPIPAPQVAVSPAFAPAATPIPAPDGAWTCPCCGASLEPNSRFCDTCGTLLTAVAPTEPSPELAPAAAAPPAPEPPSPVSLASVVRGRLVVQDSGAVLSFPPGKAEIVVGREDPLEGIFPDVDLTDHGGDVGGVSRRHARLFVQDDRLLIEDLNSANHTTVNGQPLAPGQPQPLQDGDEVRVGRVKLRFHAADG